MSRDRIRLAQFGVGRWGNHLLRNFLAMPQIDVVAVVESRLELHSAIADKFGLALSLLTTDGAAVLARADVDAVAIVTPAATHYDLIKTALIQNKHVLAEKPLTLEVEQAAELCALAESQQRQLMVDHTYLFHPAVQTGRSLLAAHRLGTLRYGYASRTNLGPVRPDVDALWDLAIHDIAIFNHWLGESPISVAAQGRIWLQGDRTAAPLFPRGLTDAAWLDLTYPSGFRAMVHVSWANPDKQRRLGVVGDRGTLIFDEMSPSPLTLQQGQLMPEAGGYVPTGLNTEAIAVPTGEPLRHMCEHFVHCVTTQQRSALSSGTVGTNLVRVLTALSESMEHDGQRIRV